jgi:hypothetical protein
MEIQWKHVFLAFALILLLINLPLIFNAVSEVISGFSTVTTNTFKKNLGTHPIKGFQTFALVKFLHEKGRCRSNGNHETYRP